MPILVVMTLHPMLALGGDADGDDADGRMLMSNGARAAKATPADRSFMRIAFFGFVSGVSLDIFGPFGKSEYMPKRAMTRYWTS